MHSGVSREECKIESFFICLPPSASTPSRQTKILYKSPAVCRSCAHVLNFFFSSQQPQLVSSRLECVTVRNFAERRCISCLMMYVVSPFHSAEDLQPSGSNNRVAGRTRNINAHVEIDAFVCAVRPKLHYTDTGYGQHQRTPPTDELTTILQLVVQQIPHQRTKICHIPTS